MTSTQYRIDVTTNVGGQTTYVARFKKDDAEWEDVPWFDPKMPSEIEARAAIQRHKDKQVAVESTIAVD